jgi:hypothetical protein
MNLLYLMSTLPANWVGFLLGMGVAVGLSWKGKIPGLDWLAVAFFNLPLLICYYSGLTQNIGFLSFISLLLVTVYGVGGFGLGWFATNVAISVMRTLRGREKPSENASRR